MSGQFLGVLLLALACGLGLSGAAAAQPFGGWLTLDGNAANYIEVPADEALNPTTGFTFEAWVRVGDPTNCVSFAGKGYIQAWWVGICSNHFRSYLRGSASGFDTAPLPANLWTHIAVVWDGTNEYHYVNGNLAGLRPATAAPTRSTFPVRIGGDSDFQFPPVGDIDEINLFNVARTQTQIQTDLSAPITGPVQGLVAVWSFNGNASDAVSVHNGVVHGNPAFSAPAPPAGSWLATNQIPGYQFKVRVTAGAPITGVQESDCTPETLCVSASVPGRSEVLIRIVGPKPNGFLWPNVTKFNTSQVEVWAEQLSTGSIKYYVLPGAWPGLDTLPGLYDRTGFVP
jgi:hypothetical protein